MYAALAFAGPGLIAANAGNDAGGIATYASAGAQFGYRTLFVMLVVTIALVVVQEMCARLGAYTGEGLGSLIREQFSIRISAFALIAFLVANLGLVVSEFAGIAAALNLVGVSRYISVPAAAVAIWSLVVFGTYRYAERLFLILSLAFLTYPVAAILAHPNWSEAAGNLVWPHVVASRGFLLLSVALIGTTITPYMQFYIAGAVADKGVGPADYKAERIDTVGGAIFADLISVFIIIATAAAIHVRAPLHSAAQAAQALRPVAGHFAEQLFALGLLGASALAAAVVPLSTAYAISEAAGAERSVGRRFREAPLFLGLFTGQVFLGAAVALIPGNLIQLLINAQLLNGIITPVLLTYVLILASRRRVLGGAANGAVYRVVATACVVVVAIMAAAALTVTVLGWFGVRLPARTVPGIAVFPPAGPGRPERADHQAGSPPGGPAPPLRRCAWRLPVTERGDGMPFIKVGQENTGSINLHYEDYGSGQPVVLIHGYPLSGRAWDKQVPALLDDGRRVITYDRRGFGRSSQPAAGYDYDTFAADLNTLLETLDLRDVTLVGHSMGTGEVTRYLGRYGSRRVNRGVLISSIPPFLLQTPDNPDGLPASQFDGFMQAARHDTPAWMKAFLDNFYNFDKFRGNLVSDQAYQASWNLAVLASAIAAVACIPTWETDFRADLAGIDVPILAIHGDEDRVLPYPNTAKRLPGMISDLQMVVIDGAPHGIPWTHEDQVNSALLKFLS